MKEMIREGREHTGRRRREFREHREERELDVETKNLVDEIFRELERIERSGRRDEIDSWIREVFDRLGKDLERREAENLELQRRLEEATDELGAETDKEDGGKAEEEV
ncbi:MAG: hypothetical protein ACFFCK_03970, partial [Promethearchaeota archaeon]